jgi:mono/diheme cytochrome c family protein
MTSTTFLSILQAVAIAFLIALPGCDYGKFKDQPSLRPYEIALPDMPAGVVPVTGGLQMQRDMDEEEMHNPVPYSPESVKQGAEQYGYFCIMCHGAHADGNGTVGQSFYPLPADLRDQAVQEQSDGALFHTISFGFNRHPPLAQTVAAPDRWNIINYLRSLSKEQSTLANKSTGH